MQHYDELFQLKAALARSDVFHLLTGAWATPAERCFFWMGGFRPSELLKVCTVPLRHCVPLPWRPSVQPRPPSQRRRAVLSLFLFFFGMQILIPQLDPLTEQLRGGGVASGTGRAPLRWRLLRSRLRPRSRCGCRARRPPCPEPSL